MSEPCPIPEPRSSLEDPAIRGSVYYFSGLRSELLMFPGANARHSCCRNASSNTSFNGDVSCACALIG